MIPQILVTLSPSGELQAELPGSNGARRVVPLQRDVSTTLLRILNSQLHAGDSVEIGEDGAPTARQVRHWTNHKTFPDYQCPFCQSEGRFHLRSTKGPRP